MRRLLRRGFARLRRVVRGELHGGPSYHALVMSRHRCYNYARSARGEPSSPLWGLETKSGSRAIALRSGVAVPALLRGPCPLDEIDWGSLPDRFVVKPDHGTASAGVLVLERQDGRYLDLLTGRHLSEDECRDAILEGNRRSYNSSKQVIVEESLAHDGRLPTAWKVFTFVDRVGLILGLRQSPEGTVYRAYSADGTDIGAIRWDLARSAQDLGLSRPAALVEAATSIAQSLNTPFVRVDLYDIPERRVIFGEFALRPGNSSELHRSVDRRLGQLWEESQGALLAKGLSLEQP